MSLFDALFTLNDCHSEKSKERKERENINIDTSYINTICLWITYIFLINSQIRRNKCISDDYDQHNHVI